MQQPWHSLLLLPGSRPESSRGGLCTPCPLPKPLCPRCPHGSFPKPCGLFQTSLCKAHTHTQTHPSGYLLWLTLWSFNISLAPSNYCIIHLLTLLMLCLVCGSLFSLMPPRVRGETFSKWVWRGHQLDTAQDASHSGVFQVSTVPRCSLSTCHRVNICSVGTCWISEWIQPLAFTEEVTKFRVMVFP